MDEKLIPVIVTAVAGGIIGEQVLKCLRFAERYIIIGTDTTNFSKGLYEVDYPEIVPPASSPDYIDTLLYLCNRYRALVCIPGSEPELKAMSKNRKFFKDAGVFLPINSEQVLDTCLNKLKTISFLKENGFSYPETINIKPDTDVKVVDFFPVIIKPLKDAGGSKNVYIAQDLEELKYYSNESFKKNNEVLVQQYIGTYDDEYTIGVLSSMNGEIINSIGIHRNIITGLGNKLKVENKTKYKDLGDYLVVSSGITQGKIGVFRPVCQQCEDIANSIKSCGPLNVQCRFVNDKVFVFEINPRFSGSSPFRALVGFNEVDILIMQTLFNKLVERYFKYNTGYAMRGLNEIFVQDLVGA